MKPVPVLAMLATGLVFAPAPGLRAEPAAVRIVTGIEQPEECLSAVRIHTIDGRSVTVGTDGFELEPGPHTMTGSAMLNTRFCTVVTDGESGPLPPLEAVFTASRVYYVGLDHAPPHVGDWRLVIWKVEDLPAEAAPASADRSIQ